MSKLTSSLSTSILMKWALNRRLEAVIQMLPLMTVLILWLAEATQKTQILGNLATKITISQLKTDQSCRATRIRWVAERAKHFSCNKTNLVGKRETTSLFLALRATMMNFRRGSRSMLKQNQSRGAQLNPDLYKVLVRWERDPNHAIATSKTISILSSNKLITRERWTNFR